MNVIFNYNISLSRVVDNLVYVAVGCVVGAKERLIGIRRYKKLILTAKHFKYLNILNRRNCN